MKRRDFIEALFLILSGLFILVSLVYYSPAKSSFFTFPPEISPGNYVGKIGIFVATYLFLGLGIVAFLLPVALIWLGVKKIKKEYTGGILLSGVSLIFGFIALCSLLYFLGLDIDFALHGGGMVGFVFSRLFELYFGKVGGVIIICGLLACFFLLNIDFSVIKRKREIKKRILSSSKISAAKRQIFEQQSDKKNKNRKRGEFRKSSSPGYRFPPIDLLDLPKKSSVSSSEVVEAGKKLQQTLKDFGVNVEIEEIKDGPAIIRYEVRLAPGIRVSRLMNLSSDLALSLAVPNVRIEVPVSGKPLVGIEVPKKKVRFVYLRELLEEKEFEEKKGKLFFPLGKNVAGETVWVNLETLPHLLIGGSTGSGKSVCINSILVSLLYRATPEEVKFLLIDPKTVELVDYAEIPHLIFPPVKDFKTATKALDWVVQEMMQRYEEFNKEGVRNIAGFNQTRKGDEIMPFLIVVIDELADLMMLAGAKLEKTLCRIAQLGRATGIHLVVATQRPSVDVITGLIKANFPSRISFAVASQVDSRTILDTVGAEKLVGNGDMLFSPVEASKPFRIQGSYISPAEVKRVVAFIREQKRPVYKDIIREVEEEERGGEEGQQDELFEEAKRLVLATGRASTSYLQRRLAIGYNRAARIMEQLEKEGIVGPARGSKPREIIVEKGIIEKKREDNESGQ
ncbi:MAG TPA: DNA translocase FtsK [Candidatus Aerophobetes bacterium]|uniref:DNA translocase FtsK n=1 Tax=Aerophobetes bacterium TaxID=2030807 RepID=A0A7V5I049_UNCAE|nr:DNA translocase FtsK [Candidatus Aerophobetes bacterium]